jgi:hypothetical protein
MTKGKSLTFSTGYHNILVMMERGGSRKSMCAAQIIVIARAFEANVKVVEVEQREELSQLFPKITASTQLPGLDQIQDNDQSENVALSPLFRALIAPSEQLTVVDVGANLDGRVFEGMVRMNMATRMSAAGRETCIVIPFYPHIESVKGACRTGRRAALAVPNCKILFCHCETGERLAAGEIESSEEWTSFIGPMIEKHGLMVMPRLQPSVISAYVASKRDPLSFTEMSDVELAPYSGDNEFIADAMRTSMKIFIDTMKKQVMESFRFFRQQQPAE